MITFKYFFRTLFIHHLQHVDYIQDYSCTKHFVYNDHYSNCYFHYIEKPPTEQGQKSNLGKIEQTEAL